MSKTSPSPTPSPGPSTPGAIRYPQGSAGRRAPRARERAAEPAWTPSGLGGLVAFVSQATPYELVDVERHGVDGRILKELSRGLDIPQLHLFEMLGVPKATAEKKMAAGEVLAGTGGQATIGMARLIARAQQIVADSTAEGAADFDATRWLGRWLDIPQPALGGRRPSELLDTPSGLEVVQKLLGALESGAYQ